MVDRLHNLLRLALILLCVFALAFFGKWLGGTLDQLEAVRSDLAAMQSKYNAAVTAQQESEKSLASLRERQDRLLEALETWRDSYERIDQERQAAQRRIKKLEAENAEIYGVLSARVPDELWRMLFPKQSSSAGNAGGDKSSGK